MARGVAAGAAGTLAMDLLWYRRYSAAGGHEPFADWELSKSVTGFDDAGAPAQVGNHLWQVAVGRPLPDERAALTNNVVHWATGAQWGVLYALVAWALGRARPKDGLVLGPVAFAASYVLLPAIDVYEPVWEYDVEVLAEDLRAHVVFGVATAAALRALSGRGGRSRRSGRGRS